MTLYIHYILIKCSLFLMLFTCLAPGNCFCCCCCCCCLFCFGCWCGLSLCLPSDRQYDIPRLLNIMIWQWVDKNIRLSIIFQSWSWWWQETKCSSINSIMNQSELNLHTHYIQLDYQSYSKLIKKEVKEPIITHPISNSSMIIQQFNV